MGIALFWIAMIGVCVCGVLGLLFFAGAVNSRAEDEYWSEYWQDTPTVEVRVACTPSDATVFKKAA
jgi:hypothetical protein